MVHVAQKLKSKKKKREERGKIKKKERKEGKESGPEAQKVGPERGWGPRQRPSFRRRYILEGCDLDLCYAWFRCETFGTSFNPSAVLTQSSKGQCNEFPGIIPVFDLFLIIGEWYIPFEQSPTELGFEVELGGRAAPSAQIRFPRSFQKC